MGCPKVNQNPKFGCPSKTLVATAVGQTLISNPEDDELKCRLNILCYLCGSHDMLILWLSEINVTMYRRLLISLAMYLWRFFKENNFWIPDWNRTSTFWWLTKRSNHWATGTPMTRKSECSTYALPIWQPRYAKNVIKISKC